MAPSTLDFDITLEQQTWELLKLLSSFLFLEESSRFGNSLTGTAFSTQIHPEYDSEGKISSIPSLMSQSVFTAWSGISVSRENKDRKPPVLENSLSVAHSCSHSFQNNTCSIANNRNYVSLQPDGQERIQNITDWIVHTDCAKAWGLSVTF